MALSGPIRTPAPFGGPGALFPFPWENLNRFDDFLRGAADEFGPPATIADLQPDFLASVVKAMMAVETGGVHRNADGTVITRDDGFGHGLSVGLMQVKPRIWQHLAPDADAFTEQGNIRLGAAIMAQAIRNQGSWQDALTKVFFPATDPLTRVTQARYVACVRGLLAEIAEAGGQPTGTGGSAIVGPPASATVVSNAAPLRREPDKDAEIVARPQAGEVVLLTGKSDNGLFPVTHQGQAGWLHRAHLAATVAADLKVCSSPRLLDDDANVVGRLAPGTTVRFRGRSRVGFVGVEQDGVRSWAFAQFLRTPEGEIDEPAAGAQAVVAEGLNLRSTPLLGTSENVVGSLAAGEAVTLTGEAALGFVTIPWGDGDAWVYAEFLAAGVNAPRPEEDVAVVGTKVTVADSGVRLRSAPDDAELINILVDGMDLRATVVLTGGGENGFLAVRYQAQEGWAAARFLQARVADTGVRLRSAPDTADPTNILIDGLAFGTTLIPTGAVANGFLSVRHGDTEGWAAARFLGPLPEIPGWTAIWGGGDRPINQDFRNETGPDLYRYGLQYCLNGREHTGIDVGLRYGDTLFAPMAGRVTCAGSGVGDGADGMGCAAFGDTGDCCPVNGVVCGKAGVGRIELLLDNGVVLILGHSRECFLLPGTRVLAGQAVGTVGGMCGQHTHIETRVRDADCSSGWRIVDPRDVLGR